MNISTAAIIVKKWVASPTAKMTVQIMKTLRANNDDSADATARFDSFAKSNVIVPLRKLLNCK